MLGVPFLLRAESAGPTSVTSKPTVQMTPPRNRGTATRPRQQSLVRRTGRLGDDSTWQPN